MENTQLGIFKLSTFSLNQTGIVKYKNKLSASNIKNSIIRYFRVAGQSKGEITITINGFNPDIHKFIIEDGDAIGTIISFKVKFGNNDKKQIPISCTFIVKIN